MQRIALLEGYLRQDPANMQLRGDLVDLLIQAERLEGARTYAIEALRIAPGDLPFRYRLAVIDHHCGSLEAAAEGLTALIDAGANSPSVRFELARVKAAQGNFRDCAEILDNLSREPLPESLAADVALLHVRALHRVGDLQLAILVAERFLQLQPDAHALASALATLYVDAQRMDDAVRLFHGAERDRPLDSEMLAVGGFVELDAANVPAALRHFEESVAKSPNSGRGLLGLGLAHAATGDLKLAKSALAGATRIMPTHLGSWHALAWMQLLDKEVDAAERSFNDALEQDRTFGDTYGGLAIIAALRGDRSHSEELIRTGRKLDRASLNVGMAVTLLQHRGAMNTNEFLESALKMLHKHALSQNKAMRASFEKLLSSRVPGRSS